MRSNCYESKITQAQRILIKFEDGYDKADEAWEELNKIVKDYSVDGKSIYSESFIEDNEAKVKALQENTNLNTKS